MPRETSYNVSAASAWPHDGRIGRFQSSARQQRPTRDNQGGCLMGISGASSWLMDVLHWKDGTTLQRYM